MFNRDRYTLAYFFHRAGPIGLPDMPAHRGTTGTTGGGGPNRLTDSAIDSSGSGSSGDDDGDGCTTVPILSTFIDADAGTMSDLEDSEDPTWGRSMVPTTTRHNESYLRRVRCEECGEEYRVRVFTDP
jgi:hypothetical protein